MGSHHAPAPGRDLKSRLASEREKQPLQYFRPHVLGTGWATPQGRGQARPRPAPGPQNPAQAPPRGLPRPRRRRPAEALERGGSGGAGRAPEGGGPGRRKKPRPEGGGGRAGGRSGPGAAGPERRRRHVRQRETQPGLYYRAPAGRLAGTGRSALAAPWPPARPGNGARAGLQFPGPA